MTVKNLSKISFDDLLDCFLVAFENYYFKMPTDKNYHKKRWKAAKVDFNLSYGMFDNEKLVGFIIHAIDRKNGVLMAFNTATGVIPEYRGKRIVNSIYEYALKDLAQNGIEKSLLEVITKNEIAIRSYKSNGFEICKKYKCFRGIIKIENSEQFEMEEMDLSSIDWENLPNQQFYSWDNKKESILEGNYQFFRILNNKEPESFFIINPDNQYLMQFDLLNTENIGWDRLFSAIKKVSDKVTIINIDERLKDKLDYINAIGLESLVDLYEMELEIEGGN